MTEFKIIDTGYANVDKDGSALSLDNRAGYNGATAVYPFTFNIKNDTINGGGSVTTQEEIRLDDNLSVISPVTYKNPTFVLACEIDRDDDLLLSPNFQTSWIYQLIRLERTKGIKLLYITSTTDRLKTLTELYGYRYRFGPYTDFLKVVESSSVSYPYIPGYVKGISNLNTNASGDKITFSITFVVTG